MKKESGFKNEVEELDDEEDYMGEEEYEEEEEEERRGQVECQMIELSSDDDDDDEEETVQLPQLPRHNLPPSTAIIVNGANSQKTVETKASDSDSSDIKILSEVEADLDVDDPDNSGMHTNDRFNVPNSEGRVIINVSEKNPEEVVYTAESIEGVIKPHQIGGVRFLYDNIIESPSNYEKSQGFGCILAHAMGLGKTLQIVTFCDIFMRYTKDRHILCIVPINTIQNWLSEFNHWLPHRPFGIFMLSDHLKNIAQRSSVIMNWQKDGGVLLIGYELFRLLAGTKAQQRKKKAPPKKKPVCIDIEEEDREKDLLGGIYIFFNSYCSATKKITFDLF